MKKDTNMNDTFKLFLQFQKPLLLQGHERSITRIKYSREGDLLFSCAKDRRPNVWYSINGERLGTYEGHDGAVWTLDCDYMTEHIVTGAADNTLRVWDIATGTVRFIF